MLNIRGSIRKGMLNTASLCFMVMSAYAQDINLDKVVQGLSPSVLSSDAMKAELAWFAKAAEPFKGMEINVVSEPIPTHTFESEVLAKTFQELTGIKVNHKTVGEGEVVQTFLRQSSTGKQVFDGYVLDTDSIGAVARYGYAVNLGEFMSGAGKDVTNPTQDLNDYIGLAFGKDWNGNLWQLPDQQFPALYYFRKDWFDKPELKAKFKELYGYDLGVPLNWSAYEDIAEFFTKHVKQIDGENVFGHVDHGKKDEALGWRFGDKFFAAAGMGSAGYPNGNPIDEYGIRIDGCRPVGSAVERGGALNSPAAVYALTKYRDWVNNFARPEAKSWGGYDVYSNQTVGTAQYLHFYAAFLPGMVDGKRPDLDMPDGLPRWRLAPVPTGPYWKEGMPIGYQDVGAWTFLKETPVERVKAAWLYAQFVTSKSVDLKKTLTGITPIRKSTIDSQALTDVAPKWGGLVEFYRSPAAKQWTPNGYNIPDYPKLSLLWWQHLGDAISGEISPQEALDRLAKEQDEIMARIEKSGAQGDCGPKMNEAKSSADWLSSEGAPWKKLENEDPVGQTIAYEDLLAKWSAK